MDVVIQAASSPVQVASGIGRGYEALRFKPAEGLQLDCMDVVRPFDEPIVLVMNCRELVAAIVVKELELSSDFIYTKNRLIGGNVGGFGVVAALRIETGIDRQYSQLSQRRTHERVAHLRSAEVVLQVSARAQRIPSIFVTFSLKYTKAILQFVLEEEASRSQTQVA